MHRPDRGARKQGGGVIETFYDGFAVVEPEPWEYLVKFDADLSFEPDYFKRCLKKFGQKCTQVGGSATVTPFVVVP